jgi:hypothetical protein
MKALSIRAPWWWYILHAGKNIENRDWPTRVRGRVLIHASKWWNEREVAEDIASAEQMFKQSDRPDLFHLNQNAARSPILLRNFCGRLVGSVEIVDCVAQSDSPWFVGDYGFVLRNPIAFGGPVAFKGSLGFFSVPDELARSLQ